MWFGVPLDEQPRCADVLWAPTHVHPELDLATLSGDVLLSALAHANPPGYSSLGVQNTARWRSIELGFDRRPGSTSGLARVCAALAVPDRLLSADLLREATTAQVSGPGPILGADLTRGLGFTPTTARRPLGPNPHSSGHFGTGGLLGFADPDEAIGLGYVVNDVVPRWQSTRNRPLTDPVYASI